MKSDLPKWVQSPFFIVPFFALCLAIPILIGMSDRAAEFAGALAAALAAVLAVVLTGWMNRANDRASEHRAHARFVLKDIRTLNAMLIIVPSLITSMQKELELIITMKQRTRTSAEIYEGIKYVIDPLTKEGKEDAIGISNAASEAMLQFIRTGIALKAALPESEVTATVAAKILPLMKSHATALAGLIEATSAAQRRFEADLEG